MCCILAQLCCVPFLAATVGGIITSFWYVDVLYMSVAHPTPRPRFVETFVQMMGVTERNSTDRSLRLVTEWCYGGTLKTVIDDAFGGEDDPPTLTYRVALNYARHIAAGVDHLHRHRLLHLDLKPANVLVMSTAIVIM